MILDKGERTIDNSLMVEDHPAGYRIVRRGDTILAMDSPDDLARCAVWVLHIRQHRPRPRSVAHIGGGLCVTAHLLGPEFDHTVYEIEPKLDQFAPGWVHFVPGDWATTLSGTFDVIIYDLGGIVDSALLIPHLNPGGLLLGVD